MRFALLLEATEASEAGSTSAEQRAAFERYEAELAQAGVLLAAEGLTASAHGTRMRNDHRTIEREKGPFSVASGLLDGIWLIDVSSKDEAVRWATDARQLALQYGDTALAAAIERDLATIR